MRIGRELVYYDPIRDGSLYIDHHVIVGTDVYDYFIRWKSIDTEPEEVHL
jgi:fructose-1,6-bisphosphatase